MINLAKIKVRPVFGFMDNKYNSLLLAALMFICHLLLMEVSPETSGMTPFPSLEWFQHLLAFPLRHQVLYHASHWNLCGLVIF